MRKILIGLAVIFLVLPVQTAAQNSCGVRSEIIKILSERFGERFQASGMSSEISVTEIWVNSEKGTWTILITGSNGISCVVLSGQNWNYAPDILKNIQEGRPI